MYYDISLNLQRFRGFFQIHSQMIQLDSEPFHQEGESRVDGTRKTSVKFYMYTYLYQDKEKKREETMLVCMQNTSNRVKCKIIQRLSQAGRSNRNSDPFSRKVL
jgi:hypothetical protein